MDGQRLDALARTFARATDRRTTLRSLFGSAAAGLFLLGDHAAESHNNWSRCKNIASKSKRAKCENKGAAHKKWHESNACRGNGQNCGSRPCCKGLTCKNGVCSKGDVLGTTPGKPGGLWITPASGFRVTAATFNIEARAYERAGEPPVSYVDFTAKPDGKPWTTLCTDYTPETNTDRYACAANPWDFGAVAGNVTISFDVYDAQRGYTLAPHGMRQGTLELLSMPMKGTAQVIGNGPGVRDHVGRDYYAVDFTSDNPAVYPAAGGTVVHSGYNCQTDPPGGPCCYGNTVAIDHGRGFYSIYTHLEANGLPALWSPVTTSTRIGTMSNTGCPAGGVHLHFAMHKGNTGLTGTNALFHSSLATERTQWR